MGGQRTLGPRANFGPRATKKSRPNLPARPALQKDRQLLLTRNICLGDVLDDLSPIGAFQANGVPRKAEVRSREHVCGYESRYVQPEGQEIGIARVGLIGPV